MSNSPTRLNIPDNWLSSDNLRARTKIPDNWPAPDYRAVRALRKAWAAVGPHDDAAEAEFRELLQRVEKSIRACHLDMILAANRASWLVANEHRKRDRKEQRKVSAQRFARVFRLPSTI